MTLMAVVSGASNGLLPWKVSLHLSVSNFQAVSKFLEELIQQRVEATSNLFRSIPGWTPLAGSLGQLRPLL